MKYLRLLGLVFALVVPTLAHADAPESTAQIQNDLRDGQAAGSITPQIIRNFAVSMFNPYPTVVSAAGTTQAGATALTAMFNIITTCSAGQGVKATAYYTKIWNATGTDCLVYPISGAQFGTAGTNVAITLPAGGAAEFIMTSTTQGYWHSAKAGCTQGANYVDGCSTAPSGTAQYPAILGSYTKRPPWNVAGVDYHVGTPVGVTFKNPTTDTLPTGCSYSSNVVTCSSGSPTLDGWNFGVGNGIALSITGGSTVTVENSKFTVGTNQVPSSGSGTARVVSVSGAVNLFFFNNEIDGAGLGGTSQASQTINVSNAGTNTWQYNYIHNVGGDIFDFNSGGTRTNIIRYNVLKDIGTVTAHADVLQWYNAVEQNDDISFNLAYQTVPYVGGTGNSGAGMGQMSLFAEGPSGSLTNSKLANNTVITTAACNNCNWVLDLVVDSGATGDHDILQNNYIDPTGVNSFTNEWLLPVKYYNDASGGYNFPTHAVVTGTVNMTTGSTYTTYPASSPYTVVPDGNGYTPPMSDVYSTTAAPAGGTITTGTVTFTLAMDQVYTVSGGTPALTLSNGRSATLTSGSGTSSLVFTYAVQSGDTATNLAISSVNLNGATIKDGVGNTANLSTVPQTFTGLNIAASGGTCPQGSTYPDGCSSALAATIQYPSMLASYTARAPWNVAGVDYPVGLPSGTTLVDPSTASLPSGCSYSANVVSCSTSGITISGYNFNLHGGIQLYLNGIGGFTVTRNNFGMTTNCLDPVIRVVGMTTSSTISYNTVDGGGATCNGIGNFGGMIFGTFNAGTTITVAYNWLKNIWQDGLDLGGPASGNATLVAKYNLFDVEGWSGHPDGMQFNGGNWINGSFAYNTYRQTTAPTAASGTQPVHVEAQLTSAISNHSTDHNTLVVPGTNSATSQDAGNGGAQQDANYVIACKQDSGSNTNTGFTAYGNYIDATGAILALINSYACTSTTWGSPLANIDMTTGATLTTTP